MLLISSCVFYSKNKRINKRIIKDSKEEILEIIENNVCRFANIICIKVKVCLDAILVNVVNAVFFFIFFKNSNCNSGLSIKCVFVFISLI
ncbi:hypothetical protein BBU72A_D0011 (plasmid) [Borreliella burgdorferi 72a]|nr:hypothetical protein BBU72A_D0011 [Borreliella burgdorferi 72a]